MERRLHSLKTMLWMLEGHPATASLKLLKLRASSSKSFWPGHHLAGFGVLAGNSWDVFEHYRGIRAVFPLTQRSEAREKKSIKQENTSLKLWNLWCFRMLVQEILSVQSTMDLIHRPEVRVYPDPDSDSNRSSGGERGCCWNHEHHSEHSRKYSSCAREV